jgi:CHAT domain-containing protein
MLMRALAIKEKILGAYHPEVAKNLNALALLRCSQGRYEESDLLCKRALTTQEKMLGPDHPDLAATYEALCGLRRYQGEHLEAARFATLAYEIRQRNSIDNSVGLSEVDALGFSRALRVSLSKYLSCRLDMTSEDTIWLQRTADMVLSCKGHVSDEIFDRQKALVQESDSATRALGESLRYVKFQLSNLFVEGPGEDAEAYRAEVDSLGMLAGDLEAQLSRRSASYRRLEDCRQISATRLISLLPENSALVEYAEYDYEHLERRRLTSHYLVVVLSATEGTSVVDLGEASAIESLVSSYRDHLLRVSHQKHLPLKFERQGYDPVASELYDALIAPIQDHITGKDLVFIAPDGPLSLISFAALLDHQGKYLIETVPIHYLTAGRDLIRLKYRDTPGRGILALGDPDYDRLGDIQLAQAGVSEAASAGSFVAHSVRSGCGALRRIEVDRLPGSRNEVEQVVARWSSYSDEPARLYLGIEATEDNLKAGAPETRVIHLATHGYFLEGKCNPEETPPSLDADRGFAGENPLLLSGLLLAGANLHGKVTDSLGCDDGILTAYEVSGMDLAGTDLVVLSACETGLGEVREGEGVYGLRRAFHIAGARTVVSALWPVPDDATAEMMVGLYGQSDKSLAERMRATQMVEIERLRSHGLSDHPYRWAGFIALGDWK